MSKIAIIGAGKTGRGYIARLIRESEREIVFIEKDKDLVDRLNKAGSFKISFFGNCREPMVIDGYTAVTYDNADLSDVELIIVSVGGTNLPDVGKSLKDLINDGKRRYIITAENASHPAATLLDNLGLDNVCAAESTVFCTTIEDGGLDIASENYPYLQCDAKPLCGYDPGMPGIRPIDGFGNFLTRKLYTYNAASCVIAYLGFVKGFSDYGDAANDPEILSALDRNYAATNRVLCKEFGYDEKDQAEFAELSKKKFCDRTIKDTVARNGREPQRKLKWAERVIGPMCLLDKYGEDISVLVATAAAALLFTNESETQWNEMVASKSTQQLINDVCGLSPDTKLGKMILKKRDELAEYMKSGKGNLI